MAEATRENMAGKVKPGRSLSRRAYPRHHSYRVDPIFQSSAQQSGVYTEQGISSHLVPYVTESEICHLTAIPERHVSQLIKQVQIRSQDSLDRVALA